MRAFLIAVGVVGIVSSVASVVSSQSKPAASPSIEGVWTKTSEVTTGANATSNMKVPGSVVIYTKTHYSLMEMNTPRQRPAPAAPKDTAKLTDAEKIARYDDWLPITANSGTYEIKGNTLTRRPTIAKGSPVPGTPTDAVRELKFEGNNKMIQIAKSPDGKDTTTRTYTRIE